MVSSLRPARRASRGGLDKIELNRYGRVSQGLPGVGQGFCLDALVEGVQVGGRGGGGAEHDFRVAGVPDDPALGGIYSVVGADFAGEGLGDRCGLQDGGAVICVAVDGYFFAPVGGDEQGQDPSQARQGEQQADGCDSGPEPAAVLAGVAADLVGQEGLPGQRPADHAGGDGYPGRACGQDEQPQQGQDETVGAVGVHQRPLVTTWTFRRGGWRRLRLSSRAWSAWVTGSVRAVAAERPRAADAAVTLAWRRRTLTVALVIPSTPGAAARSVPARPWRVMAASVASLPERSGSREARGGLSSRTTMTAPMMISRTDHTRTTKAFQRVRWAHCSQVLQCTSSGLWWTAKPMTSAITTTLPASRAAARMKASGRFTRRICGLLLVDPRWRGDVGSEVGYDDVYLVDFQPGQVPDPVSNVAASRVRHHGDRG